MTYSAPGSTPARPLRPDADSQVGTSRPGRAAPTRFYYADPLEGAGYAASASQAAALGFDALLVPPPFRPGPLGDRFLLSSLDDAHPALVGQHSSSAAPVEAIVEACGAAGIAPFMDVVLDRFAESSAPASEGPFRSQGILDPRHAGGMGAAVLGDGDEAAAQAAAQWWVDRLRPWQERGLTGVRLLGLDRLRHPATILRGLRAGLPGLRLFAWTPGMARPAVTELAGIGIDLVASSLPWWDWRSDWFWEELDALRQVGSVVLAPEAPFGPRLATAAGRDGASEAGALLRRAVAFAALAGDGWLLVGGAERGATAPLDQWRQVAATVAAADDTAVGVAAPAIGLSRDIVALNALAAGLPSPRRPIPLTPPGAEGMALLLPETVGVASDDAPGADANATAGAALVLLNASTKPAEIKADAVLPQISGIALGRFRPWNERSVDGLRPGAGILLQPGEYKVYEGDLAVPPAPAQPVSRDTAAAAARTPRVAIENPSPCVDGGAFPAKRTLGEYVTVEADVVTDGHDKLAAVLLWRAPGESTWHEERMAPVGNDRWAAGLPLEALGSHEYDITAWRDVFASYRDELYKKHQAGLPLTLELQEGASLLRAAMARSQGELKATLDRVLRELATADADGQREALLSAATAGLMWRADDRPHLARLPQPVPIECERPGAGYASWYEVFPRSLSDDPSRHGTLRDVERHLPRIAAMGFDVLYFPPIHPIGRTNRKGRNNSLRAEPGDPGSPYAIGAPEGGHDALHPELGTMDDFRRLVRAAAEHGLELALDFAIQCSPDHPWLKQHRDWFAWRPDGSIRYAENPPKKYEDIVNVDFYASGAVPDLWVALCEAVLFWAGEGVRLFRVDNPHTKPLPFWHWLIATVRKQYPDAVFLSEAFTRPKVMYRLAKVGFSQSYTYFTWRTQRWEFEQYLNELTREPPRDFFRPHFFVNTPDINPPYLHGAPREAYLTRAALAATLSGLWGVYNGFELCEGTPVQGKEEYLDSEKYQLRAWDWDRPGNIVPEITQLNRIRRLNPALHTHLGVEFLECPDDQVLWYEKATADRSNVLLVAVNLQPGTGRDVQAALPFWRWGRDEAAPFEVEDLLSGGARATWRGKWQQLRLPQGQPYGIWRVRPAA